MGLTEREHDRDSLLRWHTIAETADILGVSRVTVNNAVRFDGLPHERAFGTTLIHDEDIADLSTRLQGRK